MTPDDIEREKRLDQAARRLAEILVAQWRYMDQVRLQRRRRSDQRAKPGLFGADGPGALR